VVLGLCVRSRLSPGVNIVHGVRAGGGVLGVLGYLVGDAYISSGAVSFVSGDIVNILPVAFSSDG